MSDEILQEVSEEAQEKIIVTDKPHKEQNILNINTDDLSKKELLEFERKDLENLAREKKLLTGLKDWKIKRMSKPDFVKLLKSEVKPKPKEEVTQNENIPNSESPLNVVLLQSAVLDLVTKQDPKNLDLFCTEVVQNSNTNLIDENIAEKLNKSILSFSIAHLTIRQFGGYKVLLNKGKELFNSFKEKRANKNAN